MTLEEKLTNLCRDLWVVLPPQRQDGSWVIPFDACFDVQMLEHRSEHVMNTKVWPAVQDGVQWEVIEKAARNTYTWPGLKTHLAMDDSGALLVQSIVNQEASVDEFYEVSNAHCGFCEALMKHVNTPQPKALDYHAFISP